MEDSSPKSKLNISLLGLIAINAELHPVMQACNLGIKGGALLLIDDLSELDFFQKHLQQVDIKISEFAKATQPEPTTDGLLLHMYDIYDKPKNLHAFLSSTGRALPALVTLKTIPDCFQDFSNVIPLSEFDLSHTNCEFPLDIKEFITYVREHPMWLCETVCKFHSCKLYIENDSQSSLILSLKAATYIFCEFYRHKNTEVETEKLSKYLIECIAHFKQVINTYSHTSDVSFVVRKLFKRFVADNYDIVCANITNITGDVYDALTKDMAILYDNNHYFIPESLFKNACEPLKHTISFLNIKRMLFHENLLLANPTETQGYTVKKIVISSYGIIKRLRFLKIRREFLTTMNEPNIEERRRFSCM